MSSLRRVRLPVVLNGCQHTSPEMFAKQQSRTAIICRELVMIKHAIDKLAISKDRKALNNVLK